MLLRNLKTKINVNQAKHIVPQGGRCMLRNKFRKRSIRKNVTGLGEVLSKEQNLLLNNEIKFLNDFILLLTKMDVSQRTIDELKHSVEQLNELFLLVIVGEFNSGKSSFINAILGDKYLDEGVTPTTSNVDILRYGEVKNYQKHTDEHGASLRYIDLPIDWLKQISIVDTPGTNAVFRTHQKLTEDFVPRSDLIFWINSCDRAFSESERQFLEQMKQYNKTVVIILSKVDSISEPEELEQIKSFVSEQYHKMVGEYPIIFPVSSKNALKKAKGIPFTESPLNEFENLEKYILETLSPAQRAKLKLENPLGLAEHSIRDAMNEITKRKSIIADDLKYLSLIDNENHEYMNDMIKDFNFHQDRIDNVLLRMKERGKNFFDSNLSLSNVHNLIRKDVMQKLFEDKVVGKTSEEIESFISELVDWMTSKNSKHWSKVMSYLQTQVTKQEEGSGKYVGKIETAFDYNRREILQDISNSAGTVIKTFDKEKEAEKLSSSIQQTLIQTLLIEVGAVGFISIFSASLFDITGIIPAGIAATGLALLPYKKMVLQKQFSEQVEELRVTLRQALQDHYHLELKKGIEKLEDNVSPYAHFVKLEKTKLGDHENALHLSSEQTKQLAERIKKHF